jgi:hypothetical protein
MRGRMPGWVARSERRTVRIDGLVRLQGRDLSVTVTDLSLGGCKILCNEVLPVGEMVELKLPAVQASPATVQWTLPGKAGLRFLG